MIKATVKWWNDAKGYCFVTVEGQDVFCHYTALDGEGFKNLQEGSTIDVELIDGPKGPQVARATNWKRREG